MPTWTRLICFISTDDLFLRGSTKEATQLKAKAILGGDIYDETGVTFVSDEVATVKKLLGPLKMGDVPLVRCVGLNSRRHIKETGRTQPPFHSLFIRPNTFIHGHGAPIVIPKIAQDDQADYEGELRDPILAGPMPQWNFSKGFDTYCPLGRCLVSSALIPDPSKLHLTTRAVREVRQSEGLADLIFGGTTLRKGTVVMTGSSGGLGFAIAPPSFSRLGSDVEVSVGGIGTLRNGVVARFHYRRSLPMYRLPFAILKAAQRELPWIFRACSPVPPLQLFHLP
ncbi:uncharacterized protein BDZ99DRAFT_485353 [Mytilinidion resinicola]|uniref:Fumarylacetoacetase-like C-terminal domain-containing protein n=1 Tax=Mytilinidion resinicola TaxID=574789 RepID=A0A6A6Z0Y8_9PEZI|nr:uncharacterized protein BDZ99DRAFT_485353 [Mytilinidion resinicola]KAF2814761.1 hypothetical protein BDZ99DRAFT_485353 [Mytilinidion resinicola]